MVLILMRKHSTEVIPLLFSFVLIWWEGTVGGICFKWLTTSRCGSETEVGTRSLQVWTMEKNLPWKMQKNLTGPPSQANLCFLVWQQCPRAPTETAKTPNIASPVNLNTASECFACFYSIQTQQLTSCISLCRSDVLCMMRRETLGIQISWISLGSSFCSAHGQYGHFISICDKEEIFTDIYLDS